VGKKQTAYFVGQGKEGLTSGEKKSNRLREDRRGKRGDSSTPAYRRGSLFRAKKKMKALAFEIRPGEMTVTAGLTLQERCADESLRSLKRRRKGGKKGEDLPGRGLFP